MSPTAAMNVAATITLTPGTVISRLTCPQDSASAAISRSTSAISASRKSTWRAAESTVSRSVTGSCCSASQRRPLTPNRSEAGGRSFRQRINTAWIVVLRARARADQLRPAREPPAHRADPLIGRPDALQLSRPQQPRQRPRVEAIGLRARLADAGVARRDDDHARDMGLEDPRDLPRIARHLQRDPVARVETPRKQLKRLRPGLDPSRRPQSPVGDDRDLAEIAMDIQRYRSHLTSLLRRSSRENRWANDIDGSALAAQPGKSQGRPLNTRAQSPSSKTACPACVLPKAPRPSRPNLSRPPDVTRSPQRAVSCPETEQRGDEPSTRRRSTASRKGRSAV